MPPALDYPGIVKSIGNAWPGNPVIDEWLAAYENGTANVPTQEQIDATLRLNQSEFWDFGNDPLPPELSTGFNLSTLAPFFHKLWTDLGLNPPPLNPPAPNQETVGVDAPTSGPVNELRAFEKVSQRTLPPVEDTELDNGEPERGPRRAEQRSDEGRVHRSPAGCSVHHTRRDRGSRRRCRGVKHRG